MDSCLPSCTPWNARVLKKEEGLGVCGSEGTYAPAVFNAGSYLDSTGSD